MQILRLLVLSINASGTTLDGGNHSLTIINTGTNSTISNKLQNIGSGSSGSFTKDGSGTLILSNPASTYTSATIIKNGILEVSKLDNIGSSSSLGAPTGAAATILLGTATTNGTLYDTGASDATNRQITLNNNGEVASAGSLIFNGLISGSYALTLDGALNSSNTGTITLGVAPTVDSITSNSTLHNLILNIAAITTNNNQTYNGNVTLGVNTTLTSTNGDVSLNNGLSGGVNLLTFNGTPVGDHVFTLDGTVTFNLPASIANITVDGNSTGSNTLQVLTNNNALTWNISGTNAGTITPTTFGLTYNNIQNLVGGAANDTFIVSNAGHIVSINGGSTTNGSTNTLDYSHLFTGAVDIHMQNVTTPAFVETNIAPNVGSFANINNLLANNNSANTLTSANSPTTWNVTSTNSGNFVNNNNTYQFSNFPNLVSGTAGDIYNVTAHINSITGSPNVSNSFNVSTTNGVASIVTGGNAGDVYNVFGGGTIITANLGNGRNDIKISDSISNIISLISAPCPTNNCAGNILDYSNFTNPVNINLAKGTASGIPSSFTGISEIMANPNTENSDTITMPNSDTTITINGKDQYYLAYGASGNGITLDNFGNLNGGNKAQSYYQTYQFMGNGSITGKITTAPGVNVTLNYSQLTAPISVDLIGDGHAGTVTSMSGSTVTGTFNHVDTLVGNANAADDMHANLQLPNKSNSITFTGAGAGVYNDPVSFSGFDTFTSISGHDQIVFANGGLVIVNRTAGTAIINGIIMQFAGLDFYGPNTFIGSSGTVLHYDVTSAEQGAIDSISNQQDITMSSPSDGDTTTSEDKDNEASPLLKKAVKASSVKNNMNVIELNQAKTAAKDVQATKVNAYCGK